MTGRIATRITVAALTVTAALTATAAPAAAQSNRFTIEASFIRGAIGYAREIGSGRFAGIEVGFGFPQIDRTFIPEQDTLGGPDFEEYLHAAVFLRFAPSRNFEVDTGIRAGFGDLFECPASDCWPQPIVGAYIQPMIGWRRVKFGARLVGGWVSETEHDSAGGTGVLGLTPFIVRVTFGGS